MRGSQIVLILVTILVAACTPAAMPTAPTAVPSTPAVADAATASPTPTVVPTTVPPTPSALPPTATAPPPTAVLTEEVETDTNQDDSNVMEANRMDIRIGDRTLTATLVENSSVDALKAALSEGPISVEMRDYGNMEKVGPLGMNLPRNDEQITTEAGDVILYQGSALVIYYAPNSWNFTRLGKINNVTPEELKGILGDGDVTVTLSLP